MPDTQHIQPEKESHVTALINSQKPILRKEDADEKSQNTLSATIDNR